MIKKLRKLTAIISAVALVFSGIVYCPTEVGATGNQSLMGEELIPTEKQYSGKLTAPQTTGGEPYANEYKIDGLTLTKDCYYVATYQVASSVDKWFQLRLQESAGWSDVTGNNSAFVNTEVTAGTSVLVKYVFKSVYTGNSGVFDICYGYLNSAASTGTISFRNISLTEYDTEEAAQAYCDSLVLDESEEPTETTTDASDITWVEIGGGAAATYYYNSDHTASSIVNIQQPGWATETGVYITVGSGISTVSVNGVTTGVASIDGAGTVVYLSALTQNINTVVITYAAGVATVLIKNAGVAASEETTTAQAETTTETVTEAVTTTAAETETTTASETTTEATIGQQSAPTGFTATLIDNNTAVEIGWTSPTDSDCFLYIDGVRYANGVNGQIAQKARVEITSTLVTSTMLTAGDHTFAISTITNDSYGESEMTGTITINIPQTVPLEPEDVKVTDGVGQVALYFTESSTMLNAGENFNVYVDGVLYKEKVNQGESTYSDLTVGQHTFKVTSLIRNNAVGHTAEYIESAGKEVTGTVYEIADPTNLQATGGTNTISLTWEDTIRTSCYYIYLDDSSTAIIVTEVGATSAELTGVAAGTHKVTVKAHVVNSYSDGVNVDDIAVYDPPTAVTAINISKDYNTFTASWSDTGAASYNITITDNDGNEVELTGEGGKTDDVYSYTYTDVPANIYIYKVEAVNGVGCKSQATTNRFEVLDESDKVLTSSDISVNGFQIRLNDTSAGVAFRTICKAPAVGQTITVGDKEYTVANVGTIYGLDSNTSGDKTKNVYDSTVTLLNTEAVSGKQYTYIGKKYSGTTYGYNASEDATIQSMSTDETTYYTVTMTGVDSLVANDFHIRAYIVATDGTIIYGNSTALMSVAKVAHDMYQNSKSPNYTAHKYLYSGILNSSALKTAYDNYNNPYYLTEEKEYGWNSNIYTPTTSK